MTSLQAESSEDDEVLLKPNPTQNPPDMSPFFLKQYVKVRRVNLIKHFLFAASGKGGFTLKKMARDFGI